MIALDQQTPIRYAHPRRALSVTKTARCNPRMGHPVTPRTAHRKFGDAAMSCGWTMARQPNLRRRCVLAPVTRPPETRRHRTALVARWMLDNVRFPVQGELCGS
jgi:hypothetical protein